MKKAFLLAFIISCFTAAQAQREETLLRNMRFSGIWGSWNSAMGKVADENVYFRGGSGGIEFGGDLFLGWGDYRSSGSFTADNDRYSIRWNGPVVSYAPHSYRAVHPIFTLMVANGKIDPRTAAYKDRILVVQPSLGAELNLLRWCHVSANGGYRFVNDVNLDKLNDNDFSGLYGELSLKFGISWGRW